jgi:hypothetical protein
LAGCFGLILKKIVSHFYPDESAGQWIGCQLQRGWGLKGGEHLIRQNLALLAQAEALIEKLSHHLYTNNDNLPPFNCGVGMHIRHILDFYGAFLTIRNGAIDYDRRGRSTDVETSRKAAVMAIHKVFQALEKIDDVDLMVMSRNDSDDQEGFTRSTIGRELQFLASHTVHHYAMIAIILTIQSFSPPEGFGVAPSTLVYWQGSNSK